MPRNDNGSSSTDDGGMIDLETYEAMHAHDAPEAEVDPDALPTVSEERRAKLKEQARRMIEERLQARRRARRLMRGGER